MKRWVSVLLICVIVFGMNTVSFAESLVFLALGDSISAGYGLSDRETECFVSLVARSEDSVINKAVDGNEAVDVIDQLTDEENENFVSPELVESADIITITCGGNDMMALLYEKIAEEYPNVHPRKKEITSDEVLGKLAEGDWVAVVAAMHVLDIDNEVYYMNDGDFDARLDEFIENLLWITEYIHSLNPDVKIFVATQYNPYVEFEDTTGLDVLYFGMEDGATRLNEAIVENANEGGYIVCDVKSAFDNYTGDEDLYNANPDFDNINLDFHPAKAGHEVIGEVFCEKMWHRLGDKNSDGTYLLPENAVGYYIIDNEGCVRFVDAGIYEKSDGDYTEAVFLNVKMVEGAQVRIANGNGLRFLSMVDRSCFDAEGYGMKITCEGSDEEIFVDAVVWQEDCCFSVAIENIQEENYTRNYTAVPFVRVRYDDGSEKVIVGAQSVTRSIYTVAKGLLDNGEIDGRAKEALERYVNKN